MRNRFRSLITAGALTATLALPGAAQQAGGVMADLLIDIEQAEQKLVGLARAIPETAYGWKPADGVRTVSQVFQHVAADNYLIPALLGHSMPAGIPIKPDDYSTVQAYETRPSARDAVIADLEASFGFLKQSMRATQESGLGGTASFFGTNVTVRQGWILATTHLHEHLGQMIAYARSNGVTPPWSR